MTALRSTLVGMRNGCRSARASLIREIENHLKPLRDAAPEFFGGRGDDFIIPYLGRMFDGLRDAILLGHDVARIDIADTKADDIYFSMAEIIGLGMATYPNSIGLPCDRTARWHHASARSGVVTLIVTL